MKKETKKIINHNFFKWAIGLILFAFITGLISEGEEAKSFGIVIAKLGYIIAASYYWYKLNKNYWGILVGLISLLPFGYWVVLVIMYFQIKKKVK